MGETRKQKNARRVRQKIYDRQPGKVRQIKQLMQQVDNLPVNAITGEIIWPDKDNHE